jgi:hypothetical protein
VATSGDTVSSDGITSLVVWPTAFEIQLEHVSDKFAAVEYSLRAIVIEVRSTQLGRRSARHVSTVSIANLRNLLMANSSASGPGNAPKIPQRGDGRGDE